MKWLILMVILAFSSVTAAQGEPPPYIYYYSNALNAYVVERADGSDSHVIGQGVMPPQVADLIYGPGWSPDGGWLAWSGMSVGGFSGSAWGGFAVHIDGSERLELLDAFSSASMHWGPEGRWLLVAGRLEICAYPCRYLTYWLVDMNTQRLVTSFDMRPAGRGPGSTPIEWQQGQVIFYDMEDFGDRIQHYRITLDFEGNVTKQAISREAYLEVFIDYDGSIDLPPLDSPSGRYVGPAYSAMLTDTQTGESIPLPLHSRAASGTPPMAVNWHPSEEWVLLGSDWFETSGRGVGYVTVMSLDGRIKREISSCGFEPTCVNWLPERVDVDRLPPGEPQSVLPVPIRYDYDVGFKGGPDNQEPHVLVCDETTNTLNLVQDTRTSEIVFTLKDETPCPDSDATRPFPFALSPRGDIYATNDGYGLDAYTGLYDAATGELLVVLPTLGWELSFSEDGSRLMMRSQNARMIWDVQALLETGQEMRSRAERFQS